MTIVPVFTAIFRAPNALNFLFSFNPSFKRQYSGTPWLHKCNVVFGDRDSLVLPRSSSALSTVFPNGAGHLFKGGTHVLNIISVVSLCEQMEAFRSQNAGGHQHKLTMPIQQKFLWMVLAWTRTRREPIFNTIDSSGDLASGQAQPAVGVPRSKF